MSKAMRTTPMVTILGAVLLVFGGNAANCVAQERGGSGEASKVANETTANPALLGTLKHERHDGYSMAFSRDGKILATMGNARIPEARSAPWGLLTLWDVKQQKALGTTGVTRTGYLAFAPTGKTLAVTQGGDKIRFFSVPQLREEAVFSAPPARFRRNIATCAYSPDGNTVVSHDAYSKEIAIWDMGSREIARTLKVEAVDYGSPTYSHDGKTLAVLQSKHSIALYDTATWQVRATINLEPYSSCSVAFSPDDRLLATGSSFTRPPGKRRPDELSANAALPIQLWNARSGKPVTLGGRESEPPGHVWMEHTGRGSYVGFLPDGKVLVSATNADTVRLWDASSQRLLLEFKPHPGGWAGSELSPVEPVMAWAWVRGDVELWDLAKLLEQEAKKKVQARTKETHP